MKRVCLRYWNAIFFVAAVCVAANLYAQENVAGVRALLAGKETCNTHSGNGFSTAAFTDETENLSVFRREVASIARGEQLERYARRKKRLRIISAAETHFPYQISMLPISPFLPTQ